jgi:hypothetical protein
MVSERERGEGNTFVFAARASVLVSAGWECTPALYGRPVPLRAFAGGEHERWAVRQASALAPTVDSLDPFSRRARRCSGHRSCRGSGAILAAPSAS